KQADEQPLRLAREMPKESDQPRRRLRLLGHLGRLQQPFEQSKHGALAKTTAEPPPALAARHDPVNVSKRGGAVNGVSWLECGAQTPAAITKLYCGLATDL